MKKILLFFIIIAGLFLSLTDCAQAQKRKPVDLVINSYDGFKLSATLDIPDSASATNKAPLVIFLHSICKSKKAWNDLPLQTKTSLNVATLSVDLRGHGASILDKKNKKHYWENLTLKDYKKMPEDILEIMKYIKKEYPEVDSAKIGIVGAGLGGTAGLMAASFDNNNNIKTVIILSPMLEYKGFDLRLPIVKYGNHPLLFMVSKKDKYPYDSAQELIKFGQSKKLLKAYSFGGNAEDLLRFQPDSHKLIINWLAESSLKGKIIIENDKPKQKKPEPKYKPIGEYNGDVKVRGDIYGGVH